MQIRVRAGDTVLSATLLTNRASREFAAMLPLRLTLTDHASTEKVSDLPARLTTSDAPAGFEPHGGDLAYYAPWGNLAIFYRDFDYSDGLVKIGTIEPGVEQLTGRNGELTVTIEPVP